MEIKQTNVFDFATSFEGTTYRFAMQAESREQACQKLLKVMEYIAEELRLSLNVTKQSN